MIYKIMETPYLIGGGGTKKKSWKKKNPKPYWVQYKYKKKKNPTHVHNLFFKFSASN